MTNQLAKVEPKVIAEPIVFTVTEETIKTQKEKYLALKIAGIDDKKGLEAVKAARSDCRDARTQLEDDRVALKKPYWDMGKAIDAKAKSMTDEIVKIETHLKSEEDRIDKLIADETKRQLDERESARKKRIETAGGIPAVIRTTIAANFIRVADDAVFDEFVTNVKATNDGLKAQAEAAEKSRKDAEELRAAEAQRLKDQAAENARIKAENDERQRKLDEAEAEQAAEKKRLEDQAKALEEASKPSVPTSPIEPLSPTNQCQSGLPESSPLPGDRFTSLPSSTRTLGGARIPMQESYGPQRILLAGAEYSECRLIGDVVEIRLKQPASTVIIAISVSAANGLLDGLTTALASMIPVLGESNSDNEDEFGVGL